MPIIATLADPGSTDTNNPTPILENQVSHTLADAFADVFWTFVPPADGVLSLDSLLTVGNESIYMSITATGTGVSLVSYTAPPEEVVGYLTRRIYNVTAGNPVKIRANGAAGIDWLAGTFDPTLTIAIRTAFVEVDWITDQSATATYAWNASWNTAASRNFTSYDYTNTSASIFDYVWKTMGNEHNLSTYPTNGPVTPPNWDMVQGIWEIVRKWDANEWVSENASSFVSPLNGPNWYTEMPPSLPEIERSTVGYSADLPIGSYVLWGGTSVPAPPTGSTTMISGSVAYAFSMFSLKGFEAGLLATSFGAIAHPLRSVPLATTPPTPDSEEVTSYLATPTVKIEVTALEWRPDQAVTQDPDRNPQGVRWICVAPELRENDPHGWGIRALKSGNGFSIVQNADGPESILSLPGADTVDYAGGSAPWRPVPQETLDLARAQEAQGTSTTTPPQGLFFYGFQPSVLDGVIPFAPGGTPPTYTQWWEWSVGHAVVLRPTMTRKYSYTPVPALPLAPIAEIEGTVDFSRRIFT